MQDSVRNLTAGGDHGSGLLNGSVRDHALRLILRLTLFRERDGARGKVPNGDYHAANDERVAGHFENGTALLFGVGVD